MICGTWSTMGGEGAPGLLPYMQSASPCSNDLFYALNVHSAHLRIGHFVVHEWIGRWDEWGGDEDDLCGSF